MLLHSLMRLLVPLRRIPIHLCLRSLLRVMEIHHPNPPRQVGLLLALLPLVPLVTVVLRQSRRLAKRRATSPLKIPHRHAWLTLFIRSALTPVCLRTPHVNRAAVSRLGSASQSLLLLGHASDFTPGLRRWRLVWRLWLVIPNLFPRLFLHARVAKRLKIVLFLLRH